MSWFYFLKCYSQPEPAEGNERAPYWKDVILHPRNVFVNLDPVPATDTAERWQRLKRAHERRATQDVNPNDLEVGDEDDDDPKVTDSLLPSAFKKRVLSQDVTKDETSYIGKFQHPISKEPLDTIYTSYGDMGAPSWTASIGGGISVTVQIFFFAFLVTALSSAMIYFTHHVFAGKDYTTQWKKRSILSRCLTVLGHIILAFFVLNIPLLTARFIYGRYRAKPLVLKPNLLASGVVIPAWYIVAAVILPDFPSNPIRDIPTTCTLVFLIMSNSYAFAEIEYEANHRRDRKAQLSEKASLWVLGSPMIVGVLALVVFKRIGLTFYASSNNAVWFTFYFVLSAAVILFTLGRLVAHRFMANHPGTTWAAYLILYATYAAGARVMISGLLTIEEQALLAGAFALINILARMTVYHTTATALCVANCIPPRPDFYWTERYMRLAADLTIVQVFVDFASIGYAATAMLVVRTSFLKHNTRDAMTFWASSIIVQYGIELLATMISLSLENRLGIAAQQVWARRKWQFVIFMTYIMLVANLWYLPDVYKALHDAVSTHTVS